MVKNRWCVELENEHVTIYVTHATILIIADMNVTHVTTYVTHVMIYVIVSTFDSVTNLIIVAMNVTRLVTTTEIDVWMTGLIDKVTPPPLLETSHGFISLNFKHHFWDFK